MYTQGPTAYQPYGAPPASPAGAPPSSGPVSTFGPMDGYQQQYAPPPGYSQPPPPYQKPPGLFTPTTMTMAGLGALIGLIFFPFGWPILIGAAIGLGVGLFGQ